MMKEEEKKIKAKKKKEKKIPSKRWRIDAPSKVILYGRIDTQSYGVLALWTRKV